MFDENKRSFLRRFIPIQNLELDSNQPNRPPCAIDEQTFISRCIGVKCKSCQNACPEQFISFEEELPIWKSENRDICDICYKCVIACPTGALEQKNLVANIRLSCEPKKVQFCMDCYNSCDASAITIIKDQRPIIDNDICNGCGECVNICDFFSIYMIQK